MKGYKLKSEHQTHFEIEHPTEGSFKVAKTHLDLSAIKKIRKMFEGGGVGETSEDSGQPNQPANIAGGYACGGRVKGYDGGGFIKPEDNDAPLSPGEGGSDELVGPPTSPPPSSPSPSPPQSNGNVKDSLFDLPEMAIKKAKDLGSSAVDWAVTHAGPGNLREAEGKPSSLGRPSHQEALDNVNTQNPRMALASYGSSSSEKGTSSSTSSGMPPDQSDYFSKEKKAITDATNAKTAAQGDISDSWDDYEEKAGQAKSQMDSDIKANEAEHQKIMGMSDKLDPNRVWSNTSTPGKIGAGIGLLLSGIGSGLTGQPNLAMAAIDKAIERDMEAQKAELGQKNNLLSENLRKYGNIKQAYAATMSQLHSVTMGKVASATAQAQSAEAKAAGQAALAEIGLKQQQWDYQKSLLGSINNSPTPPSGVNLEKGRALLMSGLVPKEQQGTLQKEMDSYGQMSQKLTLLDQAFADVAGMQTAANRIGSPVQSRRQIQQKIEAYSTELAKDLDGRATPQDIKSISDNFAQFVDSPETVAAGKNNIEDLVRSKHGTFPTLHMYGLVNPRDPMLVPASTEAGRQRTRDMHLISGRR